MKRILLVLIALLLPLSYAMPVHEWERKICYRSIIVYAPAVSEGKNGYVGVITEINVTMMNGSGNVYVITNPMTQLDMQGSAKLAVDVACMLTGKDASKYDFFFKVEADSPIVGGPSAGATMTIAVICLLEKLNARNDVIMTGMINPDGSIGPVGGIYEKGEASAMHGAKYFLIPKGQSIEYRLVEEKIGLWTWYHRIPVNVSKELHEKHGIIVKEVEDINEALAYFTNYTFKEEKSEKPVITSDYYKEIMQPLAEAILKKANESYMKAKKDFENSNIPLGWYFNNPRGIVSNALDDAKNDLRDAQISYENAFYYYSISKSFQSMINSRFVEYACLYYNGNESIHEIYENVSKEVNKAIEEAKKDINGLITLQCIGAAQQRALDAKDYLNKNSTNALNKLYYLAYAMERSLTVYWWLNLSKKFNESYPINESFVEAMAEKYYNYGQSIVSYAKLIAESFSEDYIEKAEKLLAMAKEQKENYPASSLFNSLEAIANANIAIELIGIEKSDEIMYKVNRSSQMASFSIQKARNMSIEPILAVSYYEFGRSMEKEDAKASLTYYKYALMIANMLCLSKGYKVKSLKKTNINEMNENKVNEKHGKLDLMPYFMGIFGFIIGFAVGMASRRQKKKEEETKEQYMFDEDNS